MKKPTRKSLIKKCDALTTKIVQLRDKHCVTCGKTTEIYCGHYFSRTHYATRWDLRNCHAQCNPCNLRHEHDFYPYQRWMQNHYSHLEIEELHHKHTEVTHYKVSDLENILVGLKELYKIYSDS